MIRRIKRKLVVIISTIKSCVHFYKLHSNIDKITDIKILYNDPFGVSELFLDLKEKGKR